jgi:hypothetical protein
MFKNIGHFFATVYQKALTIIPAIQKTETTVETVTANANIPVYGPLALTVEKAGYAILGELSAVLHAGGEAAAAKLTDAGLDSNVIATVKALLASIPQFTALVK